MDNKIKYLIIGIIAMALIVTIKRAFAFETILIEYSSILYYSVFLIPLIIGYKSKMNALVIGTILTITNIFTEYIVLSLYVNKSLSSGNQMEIAWVSNLLSTEWFPVSMVILWLVIFTILAFIGAQIGKTLTKNEIEKIEDL